MNKTFPVGYSSWMIYMQMSDKDSSLYSKYSFSVGNKYNLLLHIYSTLLKQMQTK